MNWRPIETAPKDGTEMLGFGSFVEPGCNPQVWVISWNEQEELEEAGNGLYRKVKVGKWCSCTFFPSHWMPLPAPPIDSRESAARDTALPPEVTPEPETPFD